MPPQRFAGQADLRHDKDAKNDDRVDLATMAPRSQVPECISGLNPLRQSLRSHRPLAPRPLQPPPLAEPQT